MCLTDKRRMKKLENRHCIALTSKVQRKTVGWTLRSSVIKSFPCSSAFVCYSVGRRRTRSLEEKYEMREMSWTFLRTGVFSRGRAGIIVFRIVCTFASIVLFAQFPLCRTPVLVFHCWYTNNQHHPYIDSTTVLSDIAANNKGSLRFQSRCSRISDTLLMNGVGQVYW